MDVTTFLVSLLLGMLSLHVIRHFLYERSFPPMPSFPLPVIGHLHVMDPKFSRKSMEELRGKLGDIFSLKIGPKLTIVINGFENIKEIFLKKGEHFSGRPFFYVDWATDNANIGIVSNMGHNWKEQRTVSINILRNMGMGKNFLVDTVTEECKEYLNVLGEANGKPQDVRIPTGVSISNNICTILFGQRFQSNDVKFKRMMELLIYNLGHTTGLGNLILCLWPILHYIPGDLFRIQKVVKRRKEFNDAFKTHVQEIKGSKEYDENNMDSYISNYAREQNAKESKGLETSLNQKNMLRNIEDLISAGTDTTASTIMWFILFMLHYPKVQQKIFEDIDTNIGTERTPNMTDKSKLTYVNAAIFEAQRMGNVLPIAAFHTCSKDTLFKGYMIPKGAYVVINISSAMFDKEVWGDDVDNFRPERFLDDQGNLKHFEELIPFGIGRRACPGEALGAMELFIYITSLVQRFQFLPAIPGKPPNMEEIYGITRSPTPYQVRVVDRNVK